MNLDEALAALESEKRKSSELESKLEEWKGYSRGHERDKTKLEEELQKRVKSAREEGIAEGTATAKKESEKELKSYRVATIAGKYKLPSVLHARLEGETPEELEADAKKLATEMGLYKEPSNGTPTPAVDVNTFAPVDEQGQGTVRSANGGVKVQSADDFAALFDNA